MSYFTTGKSRFYEKMMTQKPHAVSWESHCAGQL